jgi:serine/threonine protein kinase
VDAVAALHQRRIIHLDLKLSNVMLTPEREIRLIDFGLANHLDLPDLIFESFREPKGSPAYIAPEQFIGVRDEPRSDLFSVGVMLFELSTGHLPFLDAASERDVVERINSVPLSPCHYRPELSAAFEQLVSRCLAPNPDNRFESMEALAKALAQCHQTPRPLTVPVVTQSSLNKEISGIPSLIGSYFRDRWRRRANSSYRDVERWAAQRRALRGPQRYRILATVNLNDPNEQLHRAILQQALILARAQPNAFLTVMCALSVEPGLSSGEKETTAFNDAIHNGREQVRMLIDQLDTRGCTININVTVSQRPVDTIQQYVTDYAVDLVVLGCRPKNSLASFVHGRTGYRILTSVSCNAFVVHAPNDAGNGDIPAVSAGVNA